MQKLSSFLHKPAFSAISKSAKEKATIFVAIHDSLTQNLPKKFANCFNIVNCENGTLTLGVNSLWLLWIKGHEQDLLKILNKKHGIKKIKWRNDSQNISSPVVPRNDVRISDKSSDLLYSMSKDIKHDKLRDALQRLARKEISSQTE
ncbi:MAG: hypothetical protein VX335_05020 [Pseudomonadota bacterium]|nr:hypothetical protein [Pseudomonadota bacterium]